MKRSSRDDSDNFDSPPEFEFGPKSRRERQREHSKSKNKSGRPHRNVDPSDGDSSEDEMLEPKRREVKNRRDKWRDLGVDDDYVHLDEDDD